MTLSMRLYIPTRGRVGVNRQVTLREYQMYSSYEPILVCPLEEVSLHKQYWPLVMGCPADGIGPTRQWILKSSSADIVCMLSDDMRFSYRPDPSKVKLEKCEDLDTLMAFVRQCVEDGFVHGGVGARQGNNRKAVNGERAKGIIYGGHCIVDCERVNDFHWVHREAVLRLGARFDQLPVMEDFYFTLYLLCKGVPNRVIHDYVWNQEGSGTDGGCSLYRTAQLQAEGARGLGAAFPEWVKVVVKKNRDTSPSWRDFKERLDVIVYWWKAYLAARRRLDRERQRPRGACRLDKLSSKLGRPAANGIPLLTPVQRRKEFQLC